MNYVISCLVVAKQQSIYSMSS